jgi:hypothetical protein
MPNSFQVSGDVPTLTDSGDTVRPHVVDRYPETNHEDYPLPQGKFLSIEQLYC